MQISFVQWSLKCGHQTTKLSCTKWDNCTRLHWYICEAYIGRYMGHALMMSPMFRLLACKHLLISLLTWERWMCETIFMVIRPIAAEIFQWDNRNVNLLVMREKARKWSAGFVFWGSRMTSFFFMAITQIVVEISYFSLKQSSELISPTDIHRATQAARLKPPR